MAYKMIDRVKNEDYDFIYGLTKCDGENLIASIRNDKDRVEIIRNMIPEFIEKSPGFIFKLVYDIPEFMEESFKTFNRKEISTQMLTSMLYNSPVGARLVSEKTEELAVIEEYFEIVLKCIFDTNNKDLKKKLSMYPNLHIRYLFMSYLVLHHPEEIKSIYPGDFTDYVTSVSYESKEQLTFCPKLMDSSDISKLAVYFLIKNREEDFLKLKEFILKNYEENYLASELMGSRWIVDPETKKFQRDTKIELKRDAFKKDADNLFKSSIDFRIALYLKHKDKISSEVIKEFENKLKYILEAKRDAEDYYPILYNNPTEEELDRVYRAGCGKQLELWLEKYMDISKSKEYGFINDGSTSSCFRIGDYVIKLVKYKWSYEDVICPNLFLIAKNFEEIYIRGGDDTVIGGLEVQQYLSRSAKELDPKLFDTFDRELDRLGYVRTDTLTKGTRGENTMLLDTYMDADYYNPEFLPDWFKKHPLVLVDRDRIYPKGSITHKQLHPDY